MEQLVEQWQQFIRGWWGYYQITDDRKPIFQLEGWIRRHIRLPKFFWLRGTVQRVGSAGCDLWG